jgi:hypothetical protein
MVGEFIPAPEQPTLHPQRVERLCRIFPDDLHSVPDVIIAGAVAANLVCETRVGVGHRPFDLKGHVLIFDAAAVDRVGDL